MTGSKTTEDKSKIGNDDKKLVFYVKRVRANLSVRSK